SPESGQMADAWGRPLCVQKQTLGNDGLLRCRSRFFNQCCHLARMRKKDCVAARKFNDLRLDPLRHEPLKVREARRSQAHGPLRVPSLLCWKIPINAARALPPEHASGGRAMSALPQKRTLDSRCGMSA